VLIGSARYRLLWSLIISCLQPISSPGLCSARSDFGHLISAHRPRVVLDFSFAGARNTSPHLIFLLASAEFPFPAPSGLRRSGAWLFSRCILHSGVCVCCLLSRAPPFIQSAARAHQHWFGFTHPGSPAPTSILWLRSSLPAESHSAVEECQSGLIFVSVLCRVDFIKETHFWFCCDSIFYREMLV
jgi:hypothetical protein